MISLKHELSFCLGSLPSLLLQPLTRWLILQTTVHLIWQQRLVSDGECILMESCWFAGVKREMKARPLRGRGRGEDEDKVLGGCAGKGVGDREGT